LCSRRRACCTKPRRVGSDALLVALFTILPISELAISFSTRSDEYHSAAPLPKLALKNGVPPELQRWSRAGDLTTPERIKELVDAPGSGRSPITIRTFASRSSPITPTPTPNAAS
jgi:hypothetical protein